MNTPLILIVDDIEANRETLRELLESQDYRLMEAADGPTALKLAEETPPDLVLLDVMMPGMDGFEVCRRMRADANLAEVPVVMVTALDDQDSRIAGIEAGADDFVTKPIHRAELRARVRTITRLNRYRRIHDQNMRFHWVIENACDGYVLVNSADEILFANSCARNWMGLHPDGNRMIREKFMAAVSRIFQCEPTESWKGWPEIPSGMADVSRLLVRSETPQSRAFFLEVSVHENSGDRLLWLRDVTERLTARRNQRSFQTMVEHKLRTPLNALYGSLQVLTNPADLSIEEIAEFTGVACEGANQLVDTVDDVLQFADLSGRPTSNGEFPLAGLDEMVLRVAASLGLASVIVSVDAKARGTSIACAPEALEWVLFELLENSIKFHPQGVPNVHVAASLAGEEGGVRLTIGDNGRTLPPEQLAQAGLPFFQGERDFTGEMPGMGLGLASVFTLLWQVGGSCRLRNQPAGSGICVELKWPLADTPSKLIAGNDNFRMQGAKGTRFL